MKYILTKTNNQTLGPFINVEKFDNGYMCDDVFIETIVSGEVVLSEVSDDYVNPQVQALENAAYNANQSTLRAQAYPTDSDPIFFQWQRGSKTEQDWLDAVEKVKAQYPYKETV